MSKHLFLGGPCHGEIHEVDHGCARVSLRGQHYVPRELQGCLGRRLTVFLLDTGEEADRLPACKTCLMLDAVAILVQAASPS